MTKLKKGTLISAALTILFFPIGITCFIYTFTVVKREEEMCEQINLISKQLGINFGNTKEKLEQIAAIAARNYENREGGQE